MTAEFKYQEQTTGFLIPPLMLERYERILPGFTERWFSMAERQEEHRQDLERRTLIGDGRRAWAGIACAFLICIAALAVALVIALHRQDLGGNILSGLIGAGGLIGLAGVFIYGTKVRREERAEKARLLAGRD